MLKESFESRLWRWGGNLFPAYHRSGARIHYVAPDFHEVQIRIASNWKTRNHMGITWGGSLYSALDPIYGVMLYKLLGRKFRVIDKSANIQFKKPGRETLFATFRIGHQELADIHTALRSNAKLERSYPIELVDGNGVVHVTCQKVLCVMPLEASSSTH